MLFSSFQDVLSILLAAYLSNTHALLKRFPTSLGTPSADLSKMYTDFA